jgi:anti-sigma B factor antagonist
MTLLIILNYNNCLRIIIIMEISHRTSKDAIILNLSGSLDIYTSTDYKTYLSDRMKEPQKKIIINMEKLTYIDSSGIGMLIKSMNQVKEEGSEFFIANMKEQLNKLFVVAGLSAYFNFISEKDYNTLYPI